MSLPPHIRGSSGFDSCRSHFRHQINHDRDTAASKHAQSNRPTNREPTPTPSRHHGWLRRGGADAQYTYPDQMTHGPDDDAGGPRSTVVQLPELRYDSAAHAVVFDSNGARSVCATANGRSTIFGHQLKARNTGACTVAAVAADHAEDTGWDIHRFRAIDIYFEVH